MHVPQKTCKKCQETRELGSFLSNYRSYVHTTCRVCRLKTRKRWETRGDDLGLCTEASCPHESFTNNQTLQRFAEGRNVCVGCLRTKTREGKNGDRRKQIETLFEGKRCKYCDLQHSTIPFDYFDIVDSQNRPISYSRLLRMSTETLERSLFQSQLVCINCLGENVTLYIR